MAHVAFIVPTLGRPSLRKALASLESQSDPGWLAHVVGDGVRPQVPGDPRFWTWEARPTKSAGLTRNLGMGFASAATPEGELPVEWLAFLDDDDTVTPNYVQLLRREHADVVIFRMLHPQLGVLPDPTEPQLCWGQVGISFAVRRAFVQEHHLRFEREYVYAGHPAHTPFNEDIDFLRKCQAHGARVLLHPEITYYVRPE